MRSIKPYENLLICSLSLKAFHVSLSDNVKCLECDCMNVRMRFEPYLEGKGKSVKKGEKK